jgi:hypothetical protein
MSGYKKKLHWGVMDDMNRRLWEAGRNKFFLARSPVLSPPGVRTFWRVWLFAMGRELT